MSLRTIVPFRTRRSRQVPVRRLGAQPVSNLSREFDRMFGDFFADMDELFNWPSSWTEGEAVAFTPRINVLESDKAIEISAELPGMSQEDIDISITRNVLTLKGEKKVEHEEKDKNFYRCERSFGAFARSITLPEGMVDVDQTEATFKNGVLTISLPKLPEAQEVVKQIPVKKS